MARYKLYDYILQGHEYKEIPPMTAAMAISYGDLEVEVTEVDELPLYREYVDFFREVEIWYDYGADYYFFVESDRSARLANAIDHIEELTGKTLSEEERDGLMRELPLIAEISDPEPCDNENCNY